MLRKWQQECINLAVDKYTKQQHHFLAQATPGAGKTIMAANLAKMMFELDLIDYVFCFSPSKSISNNTSHTFSKCLSRRFDGKIGSCGNTLTYQSLQHLDTDFWATLSEFRVLCVFDEIHHCASGIDANSWGQHIVSDVQGAATYTLALSGTPWRSNLTPIALARYTDPEGQLVCDYQYTLAQAINDGVCRTPTIGLIDCERSSLSTNTSIDSFSSLRHLFSDSDINYSSILFSDAALKHILKLAVVRLNAIKIDSQHAAGLVVAASINHADKISKMLNESFNQTTTVVNYKESDPHSKIEEFRSSKTQWIVSVGMVSEGTDIPRLQVCCHLSNIKTELYFRQILGRILRTTESNNQEAWLYTFAEPKLVEFAEGVEQDIPNSCLFIQAKLESHHKNMKSLENVSKPSLLSNNDADIQDLKFTSYSTNLAQTGEIISNVEDVLSLKLFKERVIEAFRFNSYSNNT